MACSCHHKKKKKHPRTTDDPCLTIKNNSDLSFRAFAVNAKTSESVCGALTLPPHAETQCCNPFTGYVTLLETSPQHRTFRSVNRSLTLADTVTYPGSDFTQVP
jgi:hypothetical protein